MTQQHNQIHLLLDEQDKALLSKVPPAISAAEREQRIAKLRALMTESGVDAVVLVAGINLQYFCGVTWALSERFVGAIISQQNVTMLCPKFEDTALHPQVQIDAQYLYWEEHESPFKLVAEYAQQHQFLNLATDPKAPLWLYSQLQSACQNLMLSSAQHLISSLREIKSPAEIALLQHAKNITLVVQKLAYRYLKSGQTASSIIQYIDSAHRALGADNGSYFCAVQFAEGTSHPHGVPGDPRLEENQLVLIDTGCRVDGYHSDITRCYAFGKVSTKIENIWQAEHQAQQAAFNAAQLGVECSKVDDAAREIMPKYDLGPDYTLPGMPHRTGHGIGLEIHEGPYLVRGDQTKLQSGMCFSNEPMIVIPGEFGVRLEDHFYMTDKGPRWFTAPQPSLYDPFAEVK